MNYQGTTRNAHLHHLPLPPKSKAPPYPGFIHRHHPHASRELNRLHQLTEDRNKGRKARFLVSTCRSLARNDKTGIHRTATSRYLSTDAVPTQVGITQISQIGRKQEPGAQGEIRRWGKTILGMTNRTQGLHRRPRVNRRDFRVHVRVFGRVQQSTSAPPAWSWPLRPERTQSGSSRVGNEDCPGGFTTIIHACFLRPICQHVPEVVIHCHQNAPFTHGGLQHLGIRRASIR